MKPTQRLGASILCLVFILAAVGTIGASDDDTRKVTIVTGHVGNLKMPFFEHPEVQRILRERYGLEVDVKGMATQEMLCPEDPTRLEGVDFLFAGEQSQVARYEDCQNRSDPFRVIFRSPMVIYSWADTIDALVRVGVAGQDDNGAFHVDMPELLELMESGKTWKDIGLPDRSSDIKVYVTDPEQSSSGNIFAAMLANTMNCLEVVDTANVDSVLQSIYTYFQGVGYLEPSSAALFNSYLTLGEGARPLAAIYESQIAEYLIVHPEDRQVIEQKVRMLYPDPTVWTSHPVIARTDLGEELMEALLDEDLQRLGWEVTGFRPGTPGVGVDLSTAPIPGILPEITSVTDIPGEAVMAQVIAATKTDPGPGDPRRDCRELAPEASPAAS